MADAFSEEAQGLSSWHGWTPPASEYTPVFRDKLAYTGLLAGILTYGGRLQRGSPGAFELAWVDCKHDKTLN